MKKLYFLAIAAIVVLMASCKNEEQQSNEQAANPEEKAQTTLSQPVGMKTAELGRQLAIYGYENKSPEALIEAANILLSIKTTTIEATPTVKDKDEKPITVAEEETQPTRSYEPKDLLAAAREFADGDATLLALIKNTEDKIAAADQAERGSFYGPRVLDKCISGENYHEYEIEFNANELAVCIISGDCSSDLDLYICDNQMNLITEDVDYTDQCYCSWTPTENTTYVIRIYNRGDKKNNYSLYLN